MAEAASGGVAGKVCPKCGYRRLAQDTAPDWQCPKCGVVYAKAAGLQPALTPAASRVAPVRAAPQAPSGFGQAVMAGLAGYVDFSGRATRAEYWWFYLFWFLALVVSGFINETLSVLVLVGLLLPNLAVSIRRLHDIGKSGWFYLINLLPLVGPLIVLYWALLPSDGDNDYGMAAS